MRLAVKAISRYGLVVAFFLALLLFPLFERTPFYLTVLIFTMMFAGLASAWNIMGGYTGYISLGHSAFFGVGAYTTLLTVNLFGSPAEGALAGGWGPFLTTPLAGLAAAVLAVGVGWVALRTRAAAFVIVTIAMVLIFQTVALNDPGGITRGAVGISQGRPPWPADVPNLSFLYDVILLQNLPQKIPFYYVVMLIMAITIYASFRIKTSKFGLGLLAIREDEGKAESVGVNIGLYKLMAFTVSAFFTGMMGGFYSYFITYITPYFVFTLLIGVQMVLMTTLGGRGTLWGPVLGAFILIPLRDLVILTYSPDILPQVSASTLHLVILAVILLLVILFLPQGILPSLNRLGRGLRRWWIRQREVGVPALEMATPTRQEPGR